MKKSIYIMLLLLVSTLSLSAGRYAGDFMMIGAGVRPLGMGGAFAAIANDGSAIFWNPSGIAQIRKSEVNLMHAFLYNGLAAYDNINYSQPLPNEVTIGFNITRLTIDDIPYFDEKYLLGTNVDQRINNSTLQLTGIPDGKFRSIDDMYQFAFAKHLRYDANLGWLFFEIPFDFYFGGNIKFIKREVFKNLGNGTGVDLGMMVKTDLAIVFDYDLLGDIALGANFQDISGTDITWDTATEHKDEILYNTKLAVAIYQPLPILNSNVILAFDRDYVYGGTNHYGIEWDYANLGSLRAGYYDENFSCGASVNVYGVNLDYALITNPVGLTNRIGLRISF